MKFLIICNRNRPANFGFCFKVILLFKVKVWKGLNKTIKFEGYGMNHI